MTRATFLLPTRPVYTVAFADDVPVHERAYVVINGVERMARVSVKWRPVDIRDVPDFQAWSAGRRVWLVERASDNVEVWERE